MPTLWQKSMISLARSERAKRVAHRVGGRSPLAKRFLGGHSPQEAVDTARRLRDELGITASLFYLGEYVADPALVAANVQGSIAVAEMLGATDLDVHVSIDPTAIG
jgi:proline dehydrogenase